MRYVYKIMKMDCPCEERLIRMKLEGTSGIDDLEFDFKNRVLTVTGNCDPGNLTSTLDSLNLGSKFVRQEDGEATVPGSSTTDKRQRKALWLVLAINLGFFIIEMATGLISRSMGLVADSLDMLADALVYGMSLAVVGATAFKKRRVGMASGYFQIFLAVIGLYEVVKRFIGQEEVPDHTLMIIVSVLALIANAVSLVILQRTRSKEVHIQASIIFSSNDVIINLGVIAAGLLVMWFGTQIPDLVIGSIVFCIVIMGAIRILSLAKK